MAGARCPAVLDMEDGKWWAREEWLPASNVRI
jgi:hypothetical protein